MLRTAVSLILILAIGAAPAAMAQDASSGAYALGVADKVKITVFNEATLSGEFLVNADGTIAMPLVGNIPAGGKSASELQAALTAQLSNGYLREPRVAVELLTYRPFYIYGEVAKPGEYVYSAGLSVMKAVALAQGFTYRADTRKILLKRAGGAEQEVRANADTQVQPGDTIRVAERYF